MEVELIEISPAIAKAVAGGDRALYGGAANAEKITPVVRNIAAMQDNLYQRTGAGAPWIGYLARDPEANAVIGSCSFVGAPQDGVVEIAYFTFPGAEGRGYGGSMAAALVALASREGSVREIIAHTLREENASTRILQRLGFARAGEAVDPEAGAVWRWALPTFAQAAP